MTKIKLLIFLEILIILVIAYKLLSVFSERQKINQYISKININDTSTDSSQLNYFYEPKANFVQKFNPDWLGYEVKNTINSDSLNEESEYSIIKDPNTYRIITIGDSFTFGYLVKTDENYSSLLENYLNSRLSCNNINHFEVINLGVYGYDVEYTIKRFIKRGIKYKPDLVIWYLNWFNFKRINEIFMPLENDIKKNITTEIDLKTGTYLVRAASRDILSNYLHKTAILNYNQRQLNYLRENIPNKLLIVSVQTKDNDEYKIINDFISSSTNYYFYDRITNTGINNELHFLDKHPNKTGHIIIAEDIYKYLIGNFFQNCNFNP